MKRQKIDIKKTIKKRIELRHQHYIFIEKRERTNVSKVMKINQKNKSGVVSDAKVHVELLIRDVQKFGKNVFAIKNRLPELKFVDYGTYNKKIRVDFDVVFCVSSFNRYEKIKRILEQIFSQETKYTFKFILMNDGSTDKRYEDLKYIFPDILYLKNSIAGGKVNYWKTINIIWQKAKEFNTYGIIQLDDDFILCNNFLNILLDTFFKVKEKNNNYMVFGFHIYGFNKNEPIHPHWFDENERMIDGGMLIDIQFMEMIDYKFDKIENRVTLRTSSFTWVRLKERIIEFGVRVYRFKNSLVWHTGNEDSKLHPNVRKGKRVYTKNFIDKDDIKKYEQYD